MTERITQAIIPVAGRGTRFLPISKAVPKELLPLGYRPLIHYAIAEAKAAGVERIIFVVNSTKKFIAEYLKRSPQLERVLEERREDNLLEELLSVDALCEGVSMEFVSEPNPAGDGHAVLQARKLLGDEAAYVLYPDDIIMAKRPAVSQLDQMFKTSQRPILALARVEKDRLSSYGVVEGEKITNRVFKVKRIVEKPEPQEARSDLVLVGRFILTPEVFDFLKKKKPNKKGEISLTETFADMVLDGQIVYGHEFEGRWLECGTKAEWLKSFLLFALTEHPESAELHAFLRKQKAI